ncbi:hypothetical protein FBU59_006784, partial [Linderina macrospora]
MAQSTLEFKINTDLLNPKFEGYQLRLLDDAKAIRSFLLSSDPVHPRQLPSNTHLTYDETSHRVRFNHLFPGPQPGTFLYIDQGNHVNLMSVSKGNVQTMQIFDIPAPVEPSAIGGYPSATMLSQDMVLVFDGFEDMYVLQRVTDSHHPQQPEWPATSKFAIGQGHVVAGSTSGKQTSFQYTMLSAYLKPSLPHTTVRIFVSHRMHSPTPAASLKPPARINARFCIQAHE